MIVGERFRTIKELKNLNKLLDHLIKGLQTKEVSHVGDDSDESPMSEPVCVRGTLKPDQMGITIGWFENQR